jgi:putative ABC transport system permease protein
MLTHYLRIAFRMFRRNKLHSLINIGCLSIGLGVVMIILPYILHEHSYDRWHKNADRIFTVMTRESFGARNFWISGLSYATGAAEMKSDPVVRSMIRTYSAPGDVEFRNTVSPDVHFRENGNLLFADSNFFEFFSFKLLRGRADEVLGRPFTIVLTEGATKKYFGEADPVGKTLMMDDSIPLEVTGIVADPPSNSTIRYDMVASLATLSAVEEFRDDLEGSPGRPGRFLTYVLLQRRTDTMGVARSLRQLSLLAEGKETGEEDNPRMYKRSHDFRLRPLADRYLSSNVSAGDKYLDAFTLVAGLILLLALVNYMSLATARPAVRAKEVGVRKVIGAGRGRIAGQFYIESGIHAVLSFVAGGLIFLWFRPYFCRLMQLPIDAGFLVSPMVLAAFGGLLMLVILVAGSYPALVLSSFRPVVVLYGKFSRERGRERVRKGFIVIQFALSMALVICSVVIGKQLYYMRHTDTGVDRENVVMIPFKTMGHYAAYRQEVSALPGIRLAATSNDRLYEEAMIELVHLPGETKPVQLDFLTVDSSFIPLMGLQWKEKPLAGSPWYDSSHLILNETAVSAFHLDGVAIGRQLEIGKNKTVTVAGVLRDFNFFSLHSRIEPFGFSVSSDVDKDHEQASYGILYLKIGPHVNVPTLIDAIHRIYSRYDTQTPFEFQFLDEVYDQNYKVEDQLAGLFDLFSAITMIIACLGLFALATFAAEQRLKEIGIRKVLGASVRSISALLSRDFLQPILLSVFIASPLAWWFMNKWLQNFAYRTSISWWVFPLAGGGLLLIAQGTVLFRTIRAARANPTINLRNE